MCCVVLFVSCNCFMPHQVAWKSRLEWFRLVADVRAVDLSVARQRRRRRGGKLQQSLPIDQRGVLAAGAVPNTLPSASSRIPRERMKLMIGYFLKQEYPLRLDIQNMN
ncbi:uncharacterized protein LOC129776208 isoform X4 [Toxorhynchites rutilus septentrionalis]|uniref:uncharacterized protein LOC129776208 isoform X4 n=1 Tax=Toxorhynchites rutilus septentrionalis TaxID=329112 RepID=UPI00247AD767|nr:uncharacterized protein LOC129776208 isoform X4 [Toxorhynchites rutilus septentrionalis]